MTARSRRVLFTATRRGNLSVLMWRDGLFRLAPIVTIGLFLGPVALGMLGTVLPAFGYLPSLGGEALSLAPWRALIDTPGIATASGLSLFTGLAATVLALLASASLMAVLGAWPRGRQWVLSATGPLFAMPHAAMAIGLAFLLSPSGWLARLLSPWLTGWQRPPDLLTVNDPYGLALIVGLVIKETPFLLLMQAAALNQIDAERQLRAARALGYHPLTAWQLVVWPQVYRQIRLPTFAVLAFAAANVDMALVLGPTTPPPLAPLLLDWFNDPDLSLRFKAAAGACWQALLVLAAFALWLVGERLARRFYCWRYTSGQRVQQVVCHRALGSGNGILVFGAGALSIAVLGLWSITDRWRFPDALPQSFQAQDWLALPGIMADPLSTTLLTAAASAGLATLLVLLCLEYDDMRRVPPRLDPLWLIYLPLLIPQISFLFGLQVLLLVIRLDGALAALIWTHLLFVLPYVYLSLRDPYRKLDVRYARTAHSLGHDRLSVCLSIKWPLLLRPILTAFAIGFSVSVAQYLPTVFAGQGRTPTLTTEAIALAAGGDRRLIGGLGLVLAALPLLVIGAAVAIPALRYRHRRGMRQGIPA